MNQRERNMLLVVLTVGGFAVLLGGFLGVQTLWDRISQKQSDIDRLQSEVQTSELKELMLMKAQQRWDRWRAISLPPDASTANNRYKGYLQDLSRRHKLQVRSLADAGGRSTSGRGGSFSPLLFTLQVEGTLGQFTSFMKEFYSINLPHQIKDITMAPTPRGTGVDTLLEATIKVEALELANIPNRDFLPAIPNNGVLICDVAAGLWGPGTPGLAVGLWSLTPVGLFGGENKLAVSVKPSRDYARLTNKNIFVGLAPAAVIAKKDSAADKDVLKFVRLTDISINDKGREVGLYNQRLNKQIRLRCEAGKDSFTVRDSNDQVILNGRVKLINQRDMIIVVDGKHFAVHIGDSLHQAMQKELNAEQLKALARLESRV